MNLHMRAPLCFASAMLLGMVTACGGGGSSSGSNNNGGGSVNPPTTTTFSDMSGNWGFAGTSAGATSADSYVGGVLNGSTSDNTISGTVHIVNIADPLGTNGGCFSLLADIPVTGTIDQSNNVKLTSATVGGQVVSVSLVYTPGNGSGTAQGTYSITGGCAGGETGKLVGATYNNISGNWTGSVRSDSTNLNYNVTGNISQPTNPSGDGAFILSGTVTFPQSQCFGAGTIQSSNNSSILIGGLAVMTVTAPDAVSGADTIFIVGGVTDPPTAKTMAVNYTVSGGVCNGDSGSGTVTRP